MEGILAFVVKFVSCVRFFFSVFILTCLFRHGLTWIISYDVDRERPDNTVLETKSTGIRSCMRHFRSRSISIRTDMILVHLFWTWFRVHIRSVINKTIARAILGMPKTPDMVL
ncbi:hypothetical protein DER46DRAFT_597753 [Fusarium sp. MPI-SDFR-AT-0072]|nr:hypothetical protein DER46DRAFT_597753 [Fusarium sp. MPI-SDFR-AT-0072]